MRVAAAFALGFVATAPALAQEAERDLGSERYWRLPTLLWLGSGDAALRGLCIAGALLSLLPAAESAAVLVLRNPVDRKRALLSRMLQRHCIATSLQLPHERVVIARTKGGKPFESSGLQRDAARSNFNFNVSHEGHLVVLASDLVRVRVSKP